MKITKEANSINFEFKNNISVSIWEEYSQFIRLFKYDWYTFNLINIEVEIDRQCGHYEILFVFFGLGMRLLIPHETKKSKEFFNTLDKQMKDIKKWKTIWIHKEELENLNKKRISAICSLRPEKYKNYKKGLLQIED